MKTKTKSTWKTEKEIENENKKEKLLTFLNECEATEQEYNPFVEDGKRLFRVLSVPQDNGSYRVEINDITFHRAILLKIADDKFHGDKLIIYTKDDVNLETSQPWNAYNIIGEVPIEKIGTIFVQRKGMGFYD